MAVSSIRTLRQRTVPLRPDPDQMRLQQIEDSWQQFPGRAPGGTGLTGLLPNDSRGYSDMLNEQTEYANLLRRREGQGPLRVVGGRGFAPEPSYTAGDALEGVAQSMPWYVTPPPPPTQPAAPQAPAAPPPPTDRGQLLAKDFVPFTPTRSPGLGSSAAIGALRRGTMPYGM